MKIKLVIFFIAIFGSVYSDDKLFKQVNECYQKTTDKLLEFPTNKVGSTEYWILLGEHQAYEHVLFLIDEIDYPD